jgi:hypothetical protein
MKNQYVLEWSHKTNNLHIQPLESHLAKNQEAFIDNQQTPEWKVIFFGTLDAVQEMADHWRDRIRLREAQKSIADAV